MFHPTLFSRRAALKTTACGFGYLAFAALASKEARAQEPGYESPSAPKAPHFTARAKRVIFLFMQGGPSHVDTFDYKPRLQADHGKDANARRKWMASPFKFARRGQSGLFVSELFDNVARHADDLCVLNGMHCDNPSHPQATIQLHTGSPRFVRPSMGSWVLYGLGTLNSNLPGFITINPPGGLGGAQNYGSAFLPAAFEGTRIDGVGDRALPNLANRFLSPPMQRRQLDLVQSMNRDLLARSGGQNQQIEGLIESYELGFRMQSSVPDVVDLTRETDATRELYGIGAGLPSDAFGRQCLLARRFAEAGVRFIEVSHGGWDHHAQLTDKLTRNCRATDKPIAGLLTDLKQRGLLDDTLVVWGGEFGRTPAAQNDDGRDHNNRGYSMWLAGGGARGGTTHGATDEHGAQSVTGKVHVHDLHATILHLLGLNHEQLTYRYAGRDFRLTDVHGNVVRDVVA
jgi:hypothetical protein